MNTSLEVNIAKAAENQREAVIGLLRAEKLPIDDLPLTLDNFFTATIDEQVIAAIGLEQYGHDALLRSMVVASAHRNNHIASGLVQQLEDFAAKSGIDNMYLLTETAQHYFEKKGYDTINREAVPATIRASSEFSHVCPVSAVVMKKKIA
jgi:amino-acid N-acetyltransferase